MPTKYIYLSDNYGRRSGEERRKMSGFLIEEERRLGIERRSGKDRRKNKADRRSGQERRGITSILIDVDGSK